MMLTGMVKVGETHMINTNQIAYLVCDDDDEGGVLLRIRWADSGQDELVLAGSRATALWDQLQRSVLDM